MLTFKEFEDCYNEALTLYKSHRQNPLVPVTPCEYFVTYESALELWDPCRTNPFDDISFGSYLFSSIQSYRRTQMIKQAMNL